MMSDIFTVGILRAESRVIMRAMKGLRALAFDGSSVSQQGSKKQKLFQFLTESAESYCDENFSF